LYTYGMLQKQKGSDLIGAERLRTKPTRKMLDISPRPL
jgi:hypothetical protein